MRSGNPVLNEKAFSQTAYDRSQVMTIQGAVGKTLILLFITVAIALTIWDQMLKPGTVSSGILMPAVIGSAIAGFIVAMVTAFKKEWSPITAPIYAACQGVFLGVTTTLLNKAYPGIAVEAVALTFGVMFCLLAAYQAGLIRATPTFVKVIVGATMGIAFIYIVSLVLGIFGIQMPMIHSSSGMGIAFSIGVVIVAALNLVLDFDLIERGAEQGAPKYMEWYSAFALLVTLVWLYIEILRLLAKLNSRR